MVSFVMSYESLESASRTPRHYRAAPLTASGPVGYSGPNPALLIWRRQALAPYNHQTKQRPDPTTYFAGNRLALGGIALYQRLTRQGPFASAYQHEWGKCLEKTVTGQPLSCSDYARDAFRQFAWPWALTLTAGRLLACGPWTTGATSAVWFERPLSPSALGHLIRTSKQGRQWVDWGQRKDWAGLLHNQVWPAGPVPPFRAGAVFNLNPADWERTFRWEKAQPARHYNSHPPSGVKKQLNPAD